MLLPENGTRDRDDRLCMRRRAYHEAGIAVPNPWVTRVLAVWCRPAVERKVVIVTTPLNTGQLDGQAAESTPDRTTTSKEKPKCC
jgi:hypothetical protein